MTTRVRDDNINTQDFWDLAWELEPTWFEGFGIVTDRWQVLTAPLQPGMKILDIGGGRGEFLNWVGADYDRTLFDHSRYAIEYATTQGWCEQGIVGDCTQSLPLKEPSGKAARLVVRRCEAVC